MPKYTTSPPHRQHLSSVTHLTVQYNYSVMHFFVLFLLLFSIRDIYLPEEDIQQVAPEIVDETTPTITPGVVTSNDCIGIMRHWCDPYALKSEGYCDLVTIGNFNNQLLLPNDGIIINYFTAYAHSGIDISNTPGSSVVSAHSGTVVWAGKSNLGGGEKVILAHGQYRTHYVHLKNITVNCGQYVTIGNKVGEIHEGYKQPHVHFSVYYKNQMLDPCDYLIEC